MLKNQQTDQKKEGRGRRIRFEENEIIELKKQKSNKIQK